MESGKASFEVIRHDRTEVGCAVNTCKLNQIYNEFS